MGDVPFLRRPGEGHFGRLAEVEEVHEGGNIQGGAVEGRADEYGEGVARCVFSPFLSLSLL
jgi:hypothetical protein